MEEEETSTSNPTEELPSNLHKIFIDPFLEYDLKGEELEWFKSKITPQKIKDKKEEKQKIVPKKVEISTEYVLEKLPEKPDKILLKLSETDTIWFFSLDTYYSQENPKDAEKVRKENETYQMKKTKKEIIRKRCMADAQTPRFIVKTKQTLTSEIVMQDAMVFASEWDMYDTYNSLGESEGRLAEPMLKAPLKSINEVAVSTEDVPKMFASLPFKYATLVTERLLASNRFQFKQAVFKKDYKTRYNTEPSQYSYTMELLWSFQKDLEQPLTVTDMDWNPLNQDLLAVGYGSLNFDQKSSGLICVWSCKNPRQPERQFSLEDSVTSLHYSRGQPNILAVGTRSGKVYVLDVSIQEGNLRLLGRDSLKTHPGPVWKVEWFLHKDLVFETEELLAVGESGVLMIFSTSIDKDTKDVLKLDYVTATEKLLVKKSSRKSNRRPIFFNEIFNKKTFSGLGLSIYSDRNFCYISTKEGAIVKCNLMSPSMTNGLFLGHDGPVYAVQHSPVTDQIFLTCGADWKIKIWMEGISEPLITLQQKVPVVCAKWSPTIPTLIASVGESELSLWDISRNILSPMSIKSFEECQQSLCSILFSKNGANLMVGTEEGLVLVVHLSELPRIPFLQKCTFALEYSAYIGKVCVVLKGLYSNKPLTSLFRGVNFINNRLSPTKKSKKENKLKQVENDPRILFKTKEALISTLRKTLLRNKNELYEKFRRTVEANKEKLKTNILDNLKQL